MSDSAAERLAKLRFLRRVQAQDLARTDRWIADEEQRTAAAQHQPLAPAPGWIVQRLPSGTRQVLHAADCWASGKATQTVDRAEAIEALADGATPCDVCQPDKVLRVS
ncbi:hypothetical protein GCM10011583_11690 [Streptomyces camponoticapitis]|uniref:Uncharacterized protein n=1 Tax=Streptomyces camponoticapitis TaxID=1616125 RepID=A0ABQ2E0J4_9ACTN|nr:DUF6233 domain-containing protein [Streptomyces camponoticapitis]GGJ81875.1 hypothetical protein GCM10011583_11690 [Streptomyces camponoticapitis]